MSGLEVKIPKEFEEQLRKRFSLKNFVNGVNNTPCPLCDLYFKNDCQGCPFNKFRSLSAVGCENWENALVGKHFGGTGMIELNKKDRGIFSKLVEKASELIEFV